MAAPNQADNLRGFEMKTKKISDLYFKRFCASFKEWQAKFGLMQYDVFFHHKPLADNYAEVTIKELAKVVSVSLMTELEGKSIEVDPGPESHAKHEVLHLLLHRLVWLGQSRYLENNDLDEEWEALVRRLEKVL